MRMRKRGAGKRERERRGEWGTHEVIQTLGDRASSELDPRVAERPFV